MGRTRPDLFRFLQQRRPILIFIVLLAVLVALALLWQLSQGPQPPLAPVSNALTPKPTEHRSAVNHPNPAIRDWPAALLLALREENPTQRAIEFGHLLKQWFDEDPEAALAYVQKMQPGAEYTQGLLILLGGFAENNPERALTLARDMIHNHEERAVYSALFDQIGRQDPTSGARFLALVPAGEAKDYAIRALAAGWATQHVNTALTWAKSFAEPTERTAAIETVLLTLSKQDPIRTLELAQQSLSGEALDRTTADALRRLTASDPHAAGDAVSQLPPGPVQTHAALDVARALASDNPETAVAWLKTLPAGQLQQLALNNVLDMWSKKDPQQARQYVTQMPPGVDQDLAVGRLAADLALRDGPDAIRWASDLENESARNAAQLNAASSWARNDPAAATRWVTALPADSPVRANALKATFSYWFLADVNAAETFAESLPKADQAIALSVKPANVGK